MLTDYTIYKNGDKILSVSESSNHFSFELENENDQICTDLFKLEELIISALKILQVTSHYHNREFKKIADRINNSGLNKHFSEYDIAYLVEIGDGI